jgi:hypothetical protein
MALKIKIYKWLLVAALWPLTGLLFTAWASGALPAQNARLAYVQDYLVVPEIFITY